MGYNLKNTGENKEHDRGRQWRWVEQYKSVLEVNMNV